MIQNTEIIQEILYRNRVDALWPGTAAARASRGEATALGSGRTAPRREREGEGEMKEGKLGAEAVEVAFHDREERRRARERKRRRDIFRRIQKEKQKLLFIFGQTGFGPDAVEAGKINAKRRGSA